LLHYDYFQKATEIKSALYNEAIKYMKRDLNREDDRFEEATDSNDDLMKEDEALIKAE